MKTLLLLSIIVSAPAVLSAPVWSKPAASSSSKDRGLSGLEDGPPLLVWRKFHSEDHEERARRLLEDAQRPTKTNANSESDDSPITLEDLLFMRKELVASKPSTAQEEASLTGTPIPTPVHLGISQQDEVGKPEPSIGTPISTEGDSGDQPSHGYGSIYCSRQRPRPASYYQRYLWTSEDRSPLSTSNKSQHHRDSSLDGTQRDLDTEAWIVWICERPYWAALAAIGFLTILFLVSVVLVEVTGLIWRALRASYFPQSCEREIGLSGPEKRLTAFPDDEMECYHDDETIIPPEDEATY